MPNSAIRRTPVLAAAVAVVVGCGLAATPVAQRLAPLAALQTPGPAGGESNDLSSVMQRIHDFRTAPATYVKAGAYTTAFNYFTQTMASTSASWSEATTKPYNTADMAFNDPASAATAGHGYVSGRVSALAVDPTYPQYVYAGAATGGVWRSANGGQTWAPISDRLPALGTGDLKIAPDHSLWLATGEPMGEEVATGVFRLANPRTASFAIGDRVGSTELDSHWVAKLTFDGNGSVFAATSRGVYKHSAVAPFTTAWGLKLAPAMDPNDPSKVSPYARDNIANSVLVQPGTNGQRLVANLAYPYASLPYNGFYRSNDGGNTWTKVNPTGAINPREVGAATMAYSADGKHLAVVMQSPILDAKSGKTELAGVFTSNNGDVAGPYTQAATSASLGNTGSALKQSIEGKGYQVGIQAWYNRVVGYDPANSNHLIIGLEEVFESWNAGATWSTIGRYWNYGFGCEANGSCDGNVLHPDQHAIAYDGQGHVYVGNDGGVYSRTTSPTATSWTDLNKSGTLRNLQFYSVGLGTHGSGLALWGGLQDNGTYLSLPERADAASPLGADGGDVLVDPTNGCKAVGEYQYMVMFGTTNCGLSDGTAAAFNEVSPTGDPNTPFTTQIKQDPVVPSRWVTAGEYVWQSDKGFSTTSADWKQLADLGDVTTGALHQNTALAVRNGVVYAGWCGSCSSATWNSGIASNAGGTWHQAKSGLPNRAVSGIAIDPSDPTGKTAYAAINGFSARYIEGPGVGRGHLFRTTDGGVTWTDVSGDSATSTTALPDVPADDVAVLPNHALVVATDLGMAIGTVASNGNVTWKRLGSNLPNVIDWQVKVSPDGKYLYVATYGRGVWKWQIS